MALKKRLPVFREGQPGVLEKALAQSSCLENPMDRGAWWVADHGVTKSRIWLSDFTFTFHFHALEKEMATHSSALPWRIPGTAEPCGQPSMGSHRVGHDWGDLAAAWSSEISLLTGLPLCAQSLSLVRLWVLGCSTPGSSVHGVFQAEYWSGLLCPPPGVLSTLGSNPHLFGYWQEVFTTEPSGKPQSLFTNLISKR